jgi:hypothetical protein
MSQSDAREFDLTHTAGVVYLLSLIARDLSTEHPHRLSRVTAVVFLSYYLVAQTGLISSVTVMEALRAATLICEVDFWERSGLGCGVRQSVMIPCHCGVKRAIALCRRCALQSHCNLDSCLLLAAWTSTVH